MFWNVLKSLVLSVLHWSQCILTCQCCSLKSWSRCSLWVPSSSVFSVILCVWFLQPLGVLPVCSGGGAENAHLHMCEHICLPLEKLKLSGEHVGELAGRLIRTILTWTLSDCLWLETSDSFITSKLLLLGKSKELLLPLVQVIILEQDG